MRQSLAFLLLLLIAGVGCGESEDLLNRDAGVLADAGPPPAPLSLEYTTPPIDVGDARYVSGLSYGPDERNVFDFFEPRSSRGAATPLVIYIHGGGFTEGSRRTLWNEENTPMLRELLAANIAVATIEYRLLSQDIDPDGVIKCLSDSRYALQYLRYHAGSFNIDPNRIGLSGNSAGAGTASWLATHDELANADAADPVERFSSRVSAIAIFETQATYDLLRWTTDVFEEYDADIIETASVIGLEQRLLNFYGITSTEELTASEIVAYRANVDMLGLMTADDAPMWVSNVWELSGEPTSVGGYFHHANHARELHEAAVAAGVESVIVAPEIELDNSNGESAGAFLIRHLQ